jgi:hypothetical protein
MRRSWSNQRIASEPSRATFGPVSCPFCGHAVNATKGAGTADHRVLGKAPLSDAQRAQRSAAGQSRARSARRHTRGTFLSRAEAERIDREYLRWLYEKPGRAGGVERALTAERDEFGMFAPTDAFGAPGAPLDGP